MGRNNCCDFHKFVYDWCIFGNDCMERDDERREGGDVSSRYLKGFVRRVERGASCVFIF